MSITQNGVFPRGSLTKIPGGWLAKGEVAESWLAMYKAARSDGVTLVPLGDDSSARSVARQVFWRNFWCGQGKCEKAAPPGTSNHGWAKAVDVNLKPGVFTWLQNHAGRFGWNNVEGQRVGEDWHWGYVGGFKPAPDPLARLPKHVRLAAKRLFFHRREAIAEAVTGEGPRYKKHVKWREFWFGRVEGMRKRSRKETTKKLLTRVLHDRDGVLD